MSTSAQPLDISALTQPGANASGPMPTPNTPAPPAETLTPAMQAPNVTPPQGINPAVPPAPPSVPNLGGHSRLLSMVQGLADGMAGFSASLATKGKVSGAEVVQNLEAQRQQSQQSAQAAKDAATDHALNQKLTSARIAELQGQNYLLMQTVPDEISKSHLAAGSAAIDLQAKAQNIFDSTGSVPQGWSVDPNTGMVSQVGQTPASGTAPTANGAPNANAPAIPSVLPGAPTVPATPNALSPAPQSSVFNNRLNMVLDAAGKELADEKGNDDPLVLAARKVVADPSSTPSQKMQAVLATQRKAGLSADVVKTLTAKAELANKQTASLPKNQQEASIQLANAQTLGDPDRIAAAQNNYNAVTQTVQSERKFASDLQAANARANKELSLSNTLAQKGIEDTNRIWTDSQHGFSQTQAQVAATKNVVGQAKTGSQLAASLEPAMLVLGVNSFAGVHRISPTEYSAAGPQVGSLYRRLNAVLDKTTKGAVPQATLSEVNGILDSLLQSKYKSSLESTRQITANTGIPANRIFVPDPNNFGALTTLDKIPVAPASNATGVTVIDPRGTAHTFPDQKSADNFKKLAGIK